MAGMVGQAEDHWRVRATTPFKHFATADGKTTELCDPQTFEVQSVVDPSVELADRSDAIEFSRVAGKLSNSVNAMSTVLSQRLDQLTEIKNAIKSARRGLQN